MREVITLQLGNYANYVGTHFWNTQESYFTYSETENSPINHDIHFRAGLGVNNVETYTPRALIYDLKGGFGSLRQMNQLYEDEQDPIDALQDRNMPWDKKREIRRQPEMPKSDFQRSLDEGTDAGVRPTDETVRNWSDYNTLFYHPRSMVKLNEFELDNKLTPFDSFDAGKDLFEGIDREQGILDQDFRHFAEECDLLSGVQTLMTVDDGWGGFGSEYISALRDEYPKTSLWVWGIERDSTRRGQAEPREVQTKRVSSTINSLSAIVAQTSCYIPIFRIPSSSSLTSSSPFVHFDHRFLASNWRSAALSAAAMETCTLPARLKGYSGVQLSDISQMLDSSHRRKIIGISLSSFKAADLENCEGEDVGSDGVNGIENDLIPAAVNLSWEETGGSSKVFSSVEVFRGTSVKAPIASGQRNRSERYKYSTDLRFPLISTYPDIFVHPPPDADVQERTSVQLRTRLSTTAAVARKLKNLKLQVKRVLALHDDREGVENNFAEMAEAYEEGWNSDSDEGDDL